MLLASLETINIATLYTELRLIENSEMKDLTDVLTVMNRMDID